MPIELIDTIVNVAVFAIAVLSAAVFVTVLAGLLRRELLPYVAAAILLAGLAVPLRAGATR